MKQPIQVQETNAYCFPDLRVQFLEGLKLRLTKFNSNTSAFRTESGNSWGWKGSLEVIQSNPPAQAGQPRANSAQPCPEGVWIYLRRETPWPLWATFVSAQFSLQQNVFPVIQMATLVLQFLPIAFYLIIGHLWIEPVLFAHSHKIFIYWYINMSFLFYRVNSRRIL